MSEHRIDPKENRGLSRKQNRRRKAWWVICPVLSAVLIAYIFLKEGALSGLAARQILRIACDACFVCGLIYSALFVISLCVYLGAFDFLQYSAGLLTDSLFRKKEQETEKKHTDFADFLQKKEGNRRLNKACLVYGAGFLLAGTVFLVLYMRA
ncbi:MAG: DUF3899 domain-containing protein [Oscillospiraceae bacterium]